MATVGDDCLQRLPRMRETFSRASDLNARYGGEEFSVLPHTTSPRRPAGAGLPSLVPSLRLPIPIPVSDVVTVAS